MKSVNFILIVGFAIIAIYIVGVYALHRAYHGGANTVFGELNHSPGITHTLATS